MTRTTKYVALDEHQATTVASVRAETGRVIARTILPTEAPAVGEFFRGRPRLPQTRQQLAVDII